MYSYVVRGAQTCFFLILRGGVAGPGLGRAVLDFATLTALGASALDAMELASAPPYLGAEVPMNLGVLLLC